MPKSFFKTISRNSGAGGHRIHLLSFHLGQGAKQLQDELKKLRTRGLKIATMTPR